MAGGIWGQTRNLDDWTLDPMDLSKRRSAVQAGCGTRMWGQTRNLSKRTFGPVDLTWGQTRCPIYRSGTFNVKRSTHNF